ncbi:hypothetical protein ACGF5F_32675 [Streptomyces sp. NPDC047821]|uniref:hypothetical protein n=1 Tax=Streptomyces sp. NPDC047821 TaxID=3365488 RepID=UPI003716B398
MANDIEIRVRVSNQTQAGLTSVNTSLNTLRSRASQAGTALTGLTGRATAATAALRALDAAAEDASDSLRRLRVRAAATSGSFADLRTDTTSVSNGLRTLSTRAGSADGRLGDLTTRTRTLRADMTDLDDTVGRLGGNLGGLRGNLASLSTASGNAALSQRRLIMAAIALAPALLPIAAAAAPIVPALGAASVAIAAFGAALIPQILNMSKISEAQKKYTDAVDEHGKFSAEATKAETAYLQVVARQSPAVREAAAALSVMKDQYKEWSKSLKEDTLGVATKSFAVFGALFPKLTPVVRGASSELDRLMNRIAAGMNTASFDAFMEKFADFSTRTLHKAVDGVINFGRKLASLGSNAEFQRFLDYAKENGPLVGETLRNLARSVATLVEGLSGAGVTVLTVVNALASLVAAVPPGALSVFIQAYAAFKLFAAGAAMVSATVTGGLIARVGAWFAVMRSAGVATTLRSTAASMSMMTKAAIGLGVVAAAAVIIDQLADSARGAPPDVDKLATSIKNLGQSAQFTGELKKTFGDMDGFVAKVNQLEQSSRDLDAAKPFLSFLPGSRYLEGAAKKLDDLIHGPSSFNAVSDDVRAFDEAFAQMVQSGNAEKAAAGFRLTQAALLADGRTMAEVKALFPEYQAAVEALAADQRIAAEAMGIFGQQAMAVQGKLDAQKQSAEGLRQAIVNLNDANRAAYDAQIGFEAALDGLTASFKEHGATLNMDTEAGRANATAMSQAAKAHDEMIAAGIGAGESLASMTGKSSKLREEMMRLAIATFQNKEEATEYVNTLLGAPGEIATLVRLEKEEAITGLQAVQAEVKKTPGAKSVRVSTLNAAAIAALEAVGLKTRRLPDGRTEVYTANGQAIGAIGSVAAAMARLDGASANTYVTTHYRITGNPNVPSGTYYGSTAGRSADGNIYAASYANGGMEQHVAQIAQPTFRLWAEPETGGEAYIPLSPAKRDRSTAILDEVARRFGYRLERFAKGGLTTEMRSSRSDILGAMTISPQWRKAGAKLTPFQKSFAQAGGVSELIATINEWKTKIKQATAGAVEKRLMTALAKTGDFLIKHQIALSKVNTALDGAKDKLRDLKDKAAQVRDQVASGITGSASITDGAQEGRPTSLGNIMASLQTKQRRSAEFAAMLQTLRSRGLGGQAISEIAQAGIDGGGFETAKALMKASAGSLQQINATQKQIAAAAADAGKTTANALYAAGIKAAEGLVKGLQAQQAKIVASMLNAAKALEKAIKRAISGKASGGIIGAAGGGPRSGLTLVGEQGPELAELAPGSRVRSNPDSRRIAAGFAAGAGGGVIQVNLVLDGRVVARQLIDPFRAEIWDRAGGNVQKALGR